MWYDHCDDAYFATIHDFTALFSDENHSTIIYARRTLAWCNTDNGLYQGLHAANNSGDWRWRFAGFHSGNWVLHHTSACWWSGWSIDFKYDCLSYAEVAELVACRGAWRYFAGGRSGSLLGL